MVLGIDLGTCNTLAATMSRDGHPMLIPDAKVKETITPSLIMVDRKISLVGSMAQQYMDLYPDKNYIRYYKRNFGTQQPVFFDDEGRAWYSETIAAMMLKKLRFDAEMMQPDNIDELVITVPAHYNDAQRKSVIEAAKLAGMELTAIIDEPVAAALSYMDISSLGDDIVMVYDFGGGTFDLTFITQTGNQIHVLAKDGLSDLGGKEFDEIIAQRIMEEYERCYRSPLSLTIATSNKLRKISENIKLEICTKNNDLYSKWLSFGTKAFEFSISRKEFSNKSVEFIAKTQKITDRCLKSIGISLSDISQIIMVGGTSHIPFIRDYWKAKIDPTRQRLVYHDPLSSVALGAAVYASSFNTDDISRKVELKSVSTYNIGIKNKRAQKSGMDILIQKNLPLPVLARRIFSITPNESIELSLIQSWDTEEETFVSGLIKIGPYNSREIRSIELSVENRSNGTIGIKVKNADTNKDLKFDFEKQESKYHYDLSEQKTLLNSVTINNIF